MTIRNQTLDELTRNELKIVPKISFLSTVVFRYTRRSQVDKAKKDIMGKSYQKNGKECIRKQYIG